MSNERCNEARLVLIAFMNEMNAWEIKYNPLFSKDGYGPHEANATEELTNIFERWCHPKSGSRDRLAALNCSDPPAYEPEGRAIIGCEEVGTAVVCDVNQTAGLKSRFKFTLKKTREGWKVAKKECGTYDGKWKTGGF